MSDMDLFKQLINSIQRQMRLMDKDQCEHIMLYTKILKTSISEQKRNKKDKIWLLVSKLDRLQVKGFCPTRLIRIDDEFMDMLVKSTSVSD
jgi:DNA mismatch repair ATPase MutL